MKSPREIHEKYGIPYHERTQIYPAKNLPLPGENPLARESNPAIIQAGERIIAEHRELLRALAKR
ncbi:hypothetical protein [Roseateles chitinivorans]|uniref:hypothetical protein n=1 Tax=Roseateles chitinivorans TaxID=2917965 RepID=UPI003D664D8F